MNEHQARALADTLAIELGPSLAPHLDVTKGPNAIAPEGWHPAGPRDSDPSSMFVLSSAQRIDMLLLIIFRWRNNPTKRYALLWDRAPMDYEHRVTEGWLWEQIDLKLSRPDWQETTVPLGCVAAEV